MENAEVFGNWVVTQDVAVDCTVEAAWSLITDVTRIGEFSPECRMVVWTAGDGVAVGNRFDGTNVTVVEFEGKQYESTWTRPCTITACIEHEVFAYNVGDRYDGSPASSWEFRLSATATGCRIVQTFRHHADGLSGIRHQADADPARATEIIATRTSGLTAGMRETLDAMKQILETPAAADQHPGGGAQ